MSTAQDLQDLKTAIENQNLHLLNEVQPDIKALATVIQALVAAFAESPKFHSAAKTVTNFHLASFQENPAITEEYLDRYLEALHGLLPPEALP